MAVLLDAEFNAAGVLLLDAEVDSKDGLLEEAPMFRFSSSPGLSLRFNSHVDGSRSRRVHYSLIWTVSRA